MRLWPRTLSLRLALLFALSSVALLGAVASYLYHSLEKEIRWRDDQALLGRLQHMQALLDDADSIETLRARPRLYQNMLGNRDSVLWIVDGQGQRLIEVNPAGLALPSLAPAAVPRLADAPANPSLRLTWLDVPRGGQTLRLIAGKRSDEREQMLAAYRMKVWMALSVAAVLAFVIGWLISQRSLRPVRALARQAAGIDVRSLHVRLDGFGQVAELQALSESLNQMLLRLEQGFMQLSRFSEDLAHEMRTPLSNLMGQTQQALDRERPAAEYQDLLVSNLEEYERLARMVDSMLLLARCEQPRSLLQRQSVDLHGLAEQLCDYFEGMAEDRDIQLLNHCHGQLIAEPALLRRALANLLANALRYAAPSSPVTLATHLVGSTLEISVHNLGEPIGAQHLPHLFERFYRCDPSRQQPDDTGGLGLAIVRSIMQAHGGQVRVASDAQGTVFTLVFALNG
ncbi:heavy metal sensor histidine kinase [Pseudomonas sp. DTU_2021_1001937_2_SI_NGA_ILE_001]|uniref:heavy metal sensor histidine kinase n=1 Tax=Pseudomonas sp. DTU_2021_1001937_2_SI_NGA_ILE_001 TaxID=3077589 RepID=UPI0028FC2CED|nr:heavy metal sensor histidine kinase [Pseudomonas sp. DTU_2021_1001937_2_SI_NGA_ILE_001]WNW13917.1 heavy metal sensor histidine kinase [Pseudomonas sp. DTU_2021_1001937_2_SI_NGA_ILE_001]